MKFEEKILDISYNHILHLYLVFLHALPSTTLNAKKMIHFVHTTSIEHNKTLFHIPFNKVASSCN